MLLFAGALLPAAGPSSSAAARPSTEPAQASETAIEAQLGSLPLYFVANRGQADERVDFYVQGSETNVYFTNRGITYLLSDRDSDKRWAVKLDFVGANRVTPQSRGRTPATINYFKGPQEDWKTDIPTYSGLVYRDLWDGIDLVYSGTASSLKQSFVVHPGADPDDIRLTYRGATSVRKNPVGEITVSTPVGGFSDARPRSFQRVRGERATVESSYQLETARKETRTYGFQVGYYDRTRTLVIDPEVVVYAGYIGGSVQDQGFGIAVDGAGAAYVTGSTISSAATFPVTGGPDLSYNEGGDAFVAKVSPGGGSLAYAGYLGGSGADEGRGIAVDGSGAAYVTGRTDSTEATFPVTGGPDLSHNGSVDAFVAKVSPGGGSLAYAGYLGGSGTDFGNGIAVDGSGAAYVSGFTHSTEATFPVTGGPDLSHNGSADAFVAKVSPGGGSLVYAGYLGGSGVDEGFGIAVDGSGAAYVGGHTMSSAATFPVTGGPDLSHNGLFDVFVAKVSPGGGSLVYAGYLGGSGNELGFGIAVDGSGAAYVTGLTDSNEATFPVTAAPDLSHNGDFDAFVAKVSPGGGSLAYAGYLGGSGNDQGHGIAVDGSGAAYVTGITESNEATFPVTAGPDLSHNGGLDDAFVAKVSPGGGSLAYAGYLGGSGSDHGYGIAVDGFGAAYVTGLTSSTAATFPVTGGPDLSYNGNFDAFVAKVGLVQDLTVSKTGGGSGTVTSSPGGIDCGLDCSESYAHGTSVTLTATPAANSAFAGWSGGGCSGTGACTVTMDAAKAVTATFEIAQRALTITKAGGGSGTVTSSPGGIDCGLDCSESYAHGTSVTLTATPAANSAFAGWSGGGCSGTGACTVTMDAAKAVTATFEIAQRALTITKAGGGSGTVTSSPGGIDCGLDCSESYAHGTSVTLTATPGEGSTFGSWKGCDEVSDDECTISLTSDTTVTVRFEATRVVHERRVTLFLGGHLVARGRVRVLDGFAACAARVPVSIQRKTPKGWVTEARRVTRDDGRFRATLDDRPDAYRVRAPARKIDGGPDACKDTLSRTVRHEHDEQPQRVAPAT